MKNFIETLIISSIMTVMFIIMIKSIQIAYPKPKEPKPNYHFLDDEPGDSFWEIMRYSN